jgi:hypothetical protein
MAKVAAVFPPTIAAVSKLPWYMVSLTGCLLSLISCPVFWSTKNRQFFKRNYMFVQIAAELHILVKNVAAGYCKTFRCNQ